MRAGIGVDRAIFPGSAGARHAWRRRVAVAGMIAVASAATPLPAAHAAADCAWAAITWPVAGQAVAGRATIYGSASIDAFQFYKLEFAGADAPERWSATSDVIRTAARHAPLDRWSTDGLPSGNYRLKLTVVDTNAQERCQRIVEPVVVANALAAGGEAAAGRRVARGDPSMPWPTAAAPRAALQPTAPITASAAADPTVVPRDAAPTAPTTPPTTPPGGGDAAGEPAPPAFVVRFGVPFAVAFAVVGALMALLARRGRRTADGRREPPL